MNVLSRYFAVLGVAAMSAMAATPLLADWVLDPERSHLSFISIKSKDIAEIHSFEKMSGRVDDEGQVDLALMLDSVETLIPIRNERMREVLFKTTDYQKATLQAKVDSAVLNGMEVGEIGELVGEARLSLHGETQPMTMHLQIGKIAPGLLMVASRKPLVVDAEQFGLGEGVEQLREIAGLESISHAVPVSFVMTFVEESTGPESSGE